ncbi:MAG: A24 family peptidase [Planctomycetota bacterium]
MPDLLPEWIAFVGLLGVVVAASVTDIRTEKIPNRLTYPAALGALSYWLLAGLLAGRGIGGQDGTLAASFIALLAGLIPFFILITIGGLGGGDMKLMAAIGAIAGRWEVVLATTVYALLIGALIAIVLMVKHKRVKLTLYRIVGIASTRGKAIKPDDLPGGPKVPFALAAAAGAAIGGAEHMLELWTPLLW